MRRQARALAAGFLGTLAAGLASAGGPLSLDESGTPLVWGTTAAIAYRTDGGPLSNNVTTGQAQARVANMFDVWQDVPSANIRYNRAGAILDVGCLHGRRREHGGGVQRRGGRLPRRRPEPDHL